MAGKKGKRVRKDFSHVSEIDWARLAALIDGEGHIQIAMCRHKSNKAGRAEYEYVNLGIANTDPRLHEWLVSRFGGKVYVQVRNGKAKKAVERGHLWKPAYRWNVACVHACDLLERARPYFILKGEQADIALALQRTKRMFGVKGMPNEVIEERTKLRAQLKLLTKRGVEVVNS